MTPTALVRKAAKLGYTIVVRCDGELDYRGTSPNAAMEAINAVDEAEVRFLGVGLRTGWALIINSLDSDEQIADCSGIVDEWTSGE